MTEHQGSSNAGWWAERRQDPEGMYGDPWVPTFTDRNGYQLSFPVRFATEGACIRYIDINLVGAQRSRRGEYEV